MAAVNNLSNAAVDEPLSPLANATTILNDEITALGQTFDALINKLHPVIDTGRGAKSDDETKKYLPPAAAPIIETINASTDRLRLMRSLANDLLVSLVL